MQIALSINNKYPAYYTRASDPINTQFDIQTFKVYL